MSGEAGGAIIGGVLVVACAPYVIAGTAMIGLAYGTLKAAGYLGKHAWEYFEKRQREKELNVSQCSTQLEALYSQMRSVVNGQVTAHRDFAEQMSKQFETLGEELKEFVSDESSVEELERRIAAGRGVITQKLSEESKVIRKRIIEDGEKQLARCIETINQSNAEKEALVQWSDRTLAAAALQKSMAQEMLRDAEASYRVVESMAKSCSDATFQNQVSGIFAALQKARAMMDAQMYQGAFANAKTVIRESAIMASEHVQNELEMDMLAMEMRAKLEGLCEEMKAQRYIEFVDETKRNKKKVRVDLDHFSQGKYKKQIELLEEYIAKCSQGLSTVYEYERFRSQYEEEIEPETRHIIDFSQKIMRGYYDRMHVLEVVADFMTEQDYQMDWAMPAGGDASQKLVVHFVQKTTGNTVSITLDNDVASGDIAKMAMEILTFYGNDRPVTEAEKQELREHLNAALSRAGFGGVLGCKGQVNQPSARTEMDSKEAVKNLPVKEIV